MKFDDLIEKLLNSLAKRAETKAKKELESRDADGQGRSTIQVSAGVNVLTNEIKAEIMVFLDDISKLNLKPGQLKRLNNTVANVIRRTYLNYEEYLDKINLKRFLQFDLSTHVDNVQAFSEFKITILRQAAWDRRRKFYWDMSKIFLSALIGGILGAYLKNKF